MNIEPSRKFLRLLFVITGCVVATISKTSAQDTASWHQAFPPHRIADNLYYVGSRGLSSYLVTSAEGHILINCSFERTVPIIRANIEKLGYKLSDIKIILSSHAHDDHVEGTATMQEMTGARVYAMEGDAEVMSGGGKGQYRYENRWKACKIDRILRDGDKVTIGRGTNSISLTAHLTAGHTRGCTTWTMAATDKRTGGLQNNRPLNVVIIGSPNVNPGYRLVNNKEYPEIAEDYARTFRTLKSLSCDIFLGAHGSYYDMEKKHAAQEANPLRNPFIDPAGYKAYVSNREEAFLDELAKQKRE